jgi:hypothetical protein
LTGLRRGQLYVVGGYPNTSRRTAEEERRPCSELISKTLTPSRRPAMPEFVKQMGYTVLAVFILATVFYAGKWDQKRQDQAIVQVVLTQSEAWRIRAEERQKENDILYVQYLTLLMSNTKEIKEF